MASITVRGLIQSSLRRINVLQSGGDLSPDDAADGLITFNDWIANVCALNRLTIYQITRTTWTLVSGTQTYTVGPSGTVNIVRPIFIDRVAFQDTAQTPVLEEPLYPLSDAEYQTIALKTQASTQPWAWYYNATFPLGTLQFFFVPTSSTLQGVIYVPTAVTQFAALTDVIALPPGYNRMLRDNLALELFPEYRENIPPDRGLIRSAAESLANVKRANAQPLDMSPGTLYGGGGSPYSIMTDGPGPTGWAR